MLYGETGKKDININTKSSHIKSAAHIENEVASRIFNNHTDKTYTFINPDFEQVDNLIKAAIDDGTKHFQRFDYNCEFVVESNHATQGNTNYFAITSGCKHQQEEINEVIE